MKLSEYSRLYRQANGLSLREMAAKCGCSFQQIDKIEKDQVKKPSLEMLYGIATGTGKTIHELVDILDDTEIVLSHKKTLNMLMMELDELEHEIINERYRIENPYSENEEDPLYYESLEVRNAYRKAPENIRTAIKTLLSIE